MDQSSGKPLFKDPTNNSDRDYTHPGEIEIFKFVSSLPIPDQPIISKEVLVKFLTHYLLYQYTPHLTVNQLAEQESLLKRVLPNRDKGRNNSVVLKNFSLGYITAVRDVFRALDLEQFLDEVEKKAAEEYAKRDKIHTLPHTNPKI